MITYLVCSFSLKCHINPVTIVFVRFPVDERGTRMSVVEYFKKRYDYKLEHTNWPCLQSGSDARPVYLPMEVHYPWLLPHISIVIVCSICSVFRTNLLQACKIVEGQRYSKKLNDKQVTNILRATCQRPQQREQSIREVPVIILMLRNTYKYILFPHSFASLARMIYLEVAFIFHVVKKCLFNI